MNKKKLFLQFIVILIASLSIIAGCDKSKALDEEKTGQADFKKLKSTPGIIDLGYYNIRCRWLPFNIDEPTYWYSLPGIYPSIGLPFCGVYCYGYSQDCWQWKIYSVNVNGQTYYLFQNKGTGFFLAGNNSYYPTNLGYDAATPTTVPFMVIYSDPNYDWADNYLWGRETIVDAGKTYYRFYNKSFRAYLNKEHQMFDNSYNIANYYLMQTQNAPSGWWSSQWILEPPHTLPVYD